MDSESLLLCVSVDSEQNQSHLYGYSPKGLNSYFEFLDEIEMDIAKSMNLHSKKEEVIDFNRISVTISSLLSNPIPFSSSGRIIFDLYPRMGEQKFEQKALQDAYINMMQTYNVIKHFNIDQRTLQDVGRQVESARQSIPKQHFDKSEVSKILRAILLVSEQMNKSINSQSLPYNYIFLYLGSILALTGLIFMFKGFFRVQDQNQSKIQENKEQDYGHNIRSLLLKILKYVSYADVSILIVQRWFYLFQSSDFVVFNYSVECLNRLFLYNILCYILARPKNFFIPIAISLAVTLDAVVSQSMSISVIMIRQYKYILISCIIQLFFIQSISFFSLVSIANGIFYFFLSMIYPQQNNIELLYLIIFASCLLCIYKENNKQGSTVFNTYNQIISILSLISSFQINLPILLIEITFSWMIFNTVFSTRNIFTNYQPQEQILLQSSFQGPQVNEQNPQPSQQLELEQQQSSFAQQMSVFEQLISLTLFVGMMTYFPVEKIFQFNPNQKNDSIFQQSLLKYISLNRQSTDFIGSIIVIILECVFATILLKMSLHFLSPSNNFNREKTEGQQSNYLTVLRSLKHQYFPNSMKIISPLFLLISLGNVAYILSFFFNKSNNDILSINTNSHSQYIDYLIIQFPFMSLSALICAQLIKPPKKRDPTNKQSRKEYEILNEPSTNIEIQSISTNTEDEQ